MKNKNTKLETFLNEVKSTIKSQGEIRSKKLLEFIETWKDIVTELHSNSIDNYIDAIRNLHHLKLTIQWIKKTTIRKRKTDKNLTLFFQHLTEYVEIEIKCIQIKHSDTTPNPNNTKSYQTIRMTWTDKKRYLMELISSLSQTTCINDGKITLTELINCFSYMFNTDLSNFHSSVNRMTGRTLNEHQSRSFFWMS
jgi:hypothetical protein